MNRYAKERTNSSSLPKVEKAKVSSRHFKLRLALTILLSVIAVASFTFGIMQLLGTDSGWQEITASSGEISCGEDFTFYYNIGASGVTAGTEKRALTELYTQLCRDAYSFFTTDVSSLDQAVSSNSSATDVSSLDQAVTSGSSVTDVSSLDEAVSSDASATDLYDLTANLYDLNASPNTVLTLSPVLYQALSALQEAGSRRIYLGPLYEALEYLCSAETDTQARESDPAYDEETSEYWQKLLSFASDPDAVNLQLLGNNQAELYVSDEYLEFIREYQELGEKDDLSWRFLDFGPLKNAFIIDYLSDSLTEAGYTLGTISSYDGCMRNLSGGDFFVTLTLYDRDGSVIRKAGEAEIPSASALVTLRDFPLSDQDSRDYYVYQDGTIRNPFFSTKDGSLGSSFVSSLTGCMENGTCSQIMLSLLPVFAGDSSFAEDGSLAEDSSPAETGSSAEAGSPAETGSSAEDGSLTEESSLSENGSSLDSWETMTELLKEKGIFILYPEENQIFSNIPNVILSE